MQTIRFGDFKGVSFVSPVPNSFAAEGRNGKLSETPTDRSKSRRFGVLILQSLAVGNS